MINQQLNDYIKQQSQQGVSKEEIKKSLLANGWNQDDLNEVFSLLEKGVAPPVYGIPNPVPKDHSAVGKVLVLLFFMIFIIVAGGAFAAYKFWYLESILGKEKAIVSDTSLQEKPVPPDPFVDKSTKSLPPDPGEEGKKTLAGIDSDHDGVRDDVQLYISKTYSNSAKMRAALTQKIKTDQKFILNSKASDEVLFSIITARNKAQDCLNYINKDPSAVLKIQKDMRAQFLNTKARSIAYVEADARLSGIFWPSPDRTKNSCDFDPDQLIN